MLGYLGHLTASAIARVWMASSNQSWRRLPRPLDAPLAHAPGADPDRLLLMGAGMAVGYGVMTHDLALPGHLARQLSERTGRGADVDVIADSDLDCGSARAELAKVHLERYDALLLVLGGLEAFTLMPPRSWRRRLTGLLDELAATAPAELRVFVVEAMTVSVVTQLPAPIREMFRRHTKRINAVSRELCETRSRVTFVEFDGGGDRVAGSVIARATYAGWCSQIVPPVYRVLRDATVMDRDGSRDEPSRQVAVDRIDVAENSVAAQLVATARDLFGVEAASVNIIDSHVQRTLFSSGGPRGDRPRSDTFCDLTIRREGVFVVEDALIDPRVAHLSMAVSGAVRFYAGYPIESADGHRIGALCLMDSAPRRFDSKDAALLRDLALRVQAALWQPVDA